MRCFLRILSLFIVLGCSNNYKNGKIASDTCIGPEHKKEFLNLILTERQVANFLHLDKEGRIPLKIVSNEHFNDSTILEIGGEPIQFIESSELHSNSLLINLKSLNCDKMTVNFEFFSNIENVSITGEINFDKGKTIKVSSIVEL